MAEKGRRASQERSHWQGLPGGININCDVGFGHVRGKTGLGCVSQKENDEFVWPGCKQLDSFKSAEEGETCAVGWAIELAESNRLAEYVIENDSLKVVKAITQGTAGYGVAAFQHEDVAYQFNSCKAKDLLWVRRQGKKKKKQVT